MTDGSPAEEPSEAPSRGEVRALPVSAVGRGSLGSRSVPQRLATTDRGAEDASGWRGGGNLSCLGWSVRGPEIVERDWSLTGRE